MDMITAKPRRIKILTRLWPYFYPARACS